jgi:hypothetical protein
MLSLMSLFSFWRSTHCGVLHRMNFFREGALPPFAEKIHTLNQQRQLSRHLGR